MVFSGEHHGRGDVIRRVRWAASGSRQRVDRNEAKHHLFSTSPSAWQQNQLNELIEKRSSTISNDAHTLARMSPQNANQRNPTHRRPSKNALLDRPGGRQLNALLMQFVAASSYKLSIIQNEYFRERAIVNGKTSAFQTGSGGRGKAMVVFLRFISFFLSFFVVVIVRALSDRIEHNEKMHVSPRNAIVKAISIRRRTMSNECKWHCTVRQFVCQVVI